MRVVGVRVHKEVREFVFVRHVAAEQQSAAGRVAVRIVVVVDRCRITPRRISLLLLLAVTVVERRAANRSLWALRGAIGGSGSSTDCGGARRERWVARAFRGSDRRAPCLRGQTLRVGVSARVASAEVLVVALRGEVAEGGELRGGADRFSGGSDTAGQNRGGGWEVAASGCPHLLLLALRRAAPGGHERLSLRLGVRDALLLLPHEPLADLVDGLQNADDLALVGDGDA